MNIEAFTKSGAVQAELVDGAWVVQRWSDTMTEDQALAAFQDWWEEHREEMESAPAVIRRDSE